MTGHTDPGTGERWFTRAELPAVPLTSHRRRRLACLLDADAPLSVLAPGDMVAAPGPNGTTLAVWTPPGPDARAAALAADPRIRTLSVVHPHADRDTAGLAVAFAAHLAQLRAPLGLPTAPVTSTRRPADVPGHLCLPHLAVLTDGNGPVDVIVWELISEAHTIRWCGLPTDRIAEPAPADLAALIIAKQRARDGTLAATGPAGADTARLLTGRYLSIRFAVQHPQLVRALIHEISQTGSRRRTGTPRYPAIPSTTTKDL